MKHIKAIDSHTGGEPTRIILSGGPDLGGGPLSERLIRLREKHDDFRSAVVNEPRGSDVLVGGLLCEPFHTDCVAGVIFFNNVGYLGMCGHGTIGLIETLKHQGVLKNGIHKIDTPLGPIEAELEAGGRVSVSNVASYRFAKDVAVHVPMYGDVVGDVAYGGNWFFLVKSGPVESLQIDNARHLTHVTLEIKAALAAAGITGADRAYIDHVELFGTPENSTNDSRNFVMCPGGAYDRSPCGTGTSAKLACLAGDGKLGVGEIWNQESITGSVFSCSYQSDLSTGHILPRITGSAFVSAELTLMFDPADPLKSGIRS